MGNQRISGTESDKRAKSDLLRYPLENFHLKQNLLTFGTVYGTSTTSSTTFINLCFWAIMFVLAVIELIAIRSLRKYNDKIYTRRSFINATLSERYQVISSNHL